jgi:tetratricopeptide (TPR) repeat protein
VDYNQRGNLYFAQEQFQRAIQDYNQAISLDASQAIYYSNRGRSYLALDLPDYAIPDLERSLQLDPTDDVTQEALNEAYQRQGGGGMFSSSGFPFSPDDPDTNVL